MKQRRFGPMRRLGAILALALIAAPAQADPNLVGAWVSSHDLTMSFARENAKLEERTLQFLDQMMGRLKLRFDKTTLDYDLPDWNGSIGGKPFVMKGFAHNSPYTVLFADAHTAVVTGLQPVTHEESVIVFHFVDDNTMWVYQGNSDGRSPDLHIREYFVKVRSQ